MSCNNGSWRDTGLLPTPIDGCLGSLGMLKGVYTARTPGAFSAAEVSMLATVPLEIVLVMMTPCVRPGRLISAE